MLPSRLAARPSCQLLLAPRPLLRRPRRQAFHPSSPRRDPIVDFCIGGANALFNTTHSWGLPWAYAIPASALIVRLLVLGPLSVRGLKTAQRRANLHPLASATRAIALRNLQTVAATVQRKDVPVLHREIERWRKLVIRGQLSRWQAGVKYSFFSSFVQLPVFLAMAESLRQKLGIGDGLLGLLVKGYRNIVEWLGGRGTTEAAPLKDMDKVVTMAPGESVSVDSGAVAPVTDVKLNTDGAIPIHSGETTTSVDVNQAYDPSLANEGMLWFQDLTVADPLHCLPFAISGLMLYNIWSGSQTLKGTSSWTRRPLLVLAFVMGPMLWDVPAGLLLYWISSNLSATMTFKAFERIWPKRIAPTACKRPLNIGPRKFTLYR